jgi:hypothetical protein
MLSSIVLALDLKIGQVFLLGFNRSVQRLRTGSRSFQGTGQLAMCRWKDIDLRSHRRSPDLANTKAMAARCFRT